MHTDHYAAQVIYRDELARLELANERIRQAIERGELAPAAKATKRSGRLAAFFAARRIRTAH